MKTKTTQLVYPYRRWFIISLFFCGMLGLVFRAIHLQLLNNDFLQKHGDARSVRIVNMPVHRGVILDRNGENLALSTPIESIWAVPRKTLGDTDKLPQLSKILGMNTTELKEILRVRINRDFIYLKRHCDPDIVRKVQDLNVSGVSTQREYKRYYPSAEITSHLIGFTDIDDKGQEGLELAYNSWLAGEPGLKRVLKDRLNRIVENIENIKASKLGKSLTLSIDRRLQYMAYRELAFAVKNHNATSGSLVMLDIKTGEVLAMVGYPSYNPNNRSSLKNKFYRNRAVTDVFEPGSTIKPFIIAGALEDGLYKPNTKIDTTPGYLKVGNHSVRDANNYGNIDITKVITKSSNVGMSKIALSLGSEKILNMLFDFGFGKNTGGIFPGESFGSLPLYNSLSDIEIATMSFGYGLSVTTLQLAHAYAVLANDGVMLPVSFTKTESIKQGKRILPINIARQVRQMLETVVSNEGTGKRAAVEGYRVIGKTGTVHKIFQNNYSDDNYISLFAGIAPASSPRVAMVILIDDPKNSSYFGGVVAAPVFSKVMKKTFQILNIPPDALPATKTPILVKQNYSSNLQGLGS